MDKYIIINKETNQIVCKAKNGRHYRQSIGHIGDGLVVCTTTKGRAEKERDYLNQEYNKGWEIQKVEPIVFKDNREDVEKRMEEYEDEIKNAQKQAVKEVIEKINEKICTFILGHKSQEFIDGYTEAIAEVCGRLDEIAKELGVEL